MDPPVYYNHASSSPSPYYLQGYTFAGDLAVQAQPGGEGFRSLDFGNLGWGLAGQVQAGPIVTERERQDARRDSHGLFRYSDCDLAELRKFIHERHLSKNMLKPRYWDKNRLIDLLQFGDKQITIDFTSLPAELRNAICELHFAYLEKSGLAVKYPQPPVTRSSRATRGEILPLFYQMSTFSLEYHGRTYCTTRHQSEPYGAVSRTVWGHWIVREPMALTLESKAFLDRVPQQWLRLIKRFQLTVTQHFYSELPLTLSITMEIDRIKGVHAASVRDVTNEAFRQITVEKKVQTYINGVMEEIRSRHAGSEDKADSCVRPSDLSGLRGHFEDIAGQHGR